MPVGPTYLLQLDCDLGVDSVMQMLGELPSPIMEEPMSQRGTAPNTPHTLRPHPPAQHSIEAKAARQAAVALQSKLTVVFSSWFKQDCYMILVRSAY